MFQMFYFVNEIICTNTIGHRFLCHMVEFELDCTVNFRLYLLFPLLVLFHMNQNKLNYFYQSKPNDFLFYLSLVN